LHTGFEIRRATESDIEFIQALTREVFTDYAAEIGANVDALTETYDDIKNDINNKLVFIAFSDGLPSGSVRVEVKDGAAYLYRFGVRREYQGNGVGKAVMNVVDRAMMDLDVKRITLYTASKAAALVRFYYARGFYIDSTTKDRGYIRAMMVKEYF